MTITFPHSLFGGNPSGSAVTRHCSLLRVFVFGCEHHELNDWLVFLQSSSVCAQVPLMHRDSLKTARYLSSVLSEVAFISSFKPFDSSVWSPHFTDRSAGPERVKLGATVTSGEEMVVFKPGILDVEDNALSSKKCYHLKESNRISTCSQFCISEFSVIWVFVSHIFFFSPYCFPL